MPAPGARPAEEPSRDAVIIVLYGPHLGRRFALGAAETIIGRAPDIGISLDTDSVSRRHARLYATEVGVVLEDLGSTNGSYVNDRPVERAVLNDGDQIRLGSVILKFLVGSN